MRLSKLITAGEEADVHGEDREIAGITADSRQVAPGFLFVAIPGTAHDGRGFITEAILSGATAILMPRSEEPLSIPANVTSLQVRDVRTALATIAARFYPLQPPVIAAVTGTSGKTSTAQFTRQIWQALGKKSASIGTLGLVTEIETLYGSLTTPDALTLHRMLDQLAREAYTHVALEASSHGLSMHRLDETHILAAGFTNLSRDHLDFHGSMEAYLECKLKLFNSVLPAGGVAVLNADAKEFHVFAEVAKKRGQKIISFGKETSDLRLLSQRPETDGQRLELDIFGLKTTVKLPVIGEFQASNALCALGLAIAGGENAGSAAAALSSVTTVPGRMEFIGRNQAGGLIFVDYAHKPDALEKVLTAVRPHLAMHSGTKLGLVFGCGGNRDKGKRPMMGEIAERLADFIIVTDDNPRDEDPKSIRHDILAGQKKLKPVAEVADRAEAIKRAISEMHKDDILIIAGKGHERGQIVGKETLPFDDAQVARIAIGQ